MEPAAPALDHLELHNLVDHLLIDLRRLRDEPIILNSLFVVVFWVNNTQVRASRLGIPFLRSFAFSRYVENLFLLLVTYPCKIEQAGRRMLA